MWTFVLCAGIRHVPQLAARPKNGTGTSCASRGSINALARCVGLDDPPSRRFDDRLAIAGIATRTIQNANEA
jgi:hypothetical protein